MRAAGAGGLTVLVAPGGGLSSLTHDDGAGALELLQHAASAYEPGLFGVWVRDRASGRAWPTLGAGSGAAVTATDDGLVATGGADGLRWRVTLRLHDARPAWALAVRVTAEGPGTREIDTREIDVVHTHDLALATPGAVRANELYVSQYLDLTPLEGPTGVALAVRQNQPQGGRHPLAVVAADRQVVGWATDALAVHGLAGRADGPLLTAADLPSRRLQHEHTLAALQVAPARLAPGEELAVTFAGLLVPDHPSTTTPDDVALVREALALGAAAFRGGSVAETAIDPPQSAGADGRPLAGSAYDRGRELAVRDLAEDELADRWPGRWRLVERDDDGALLSFFAGDEHVVTRAKERAVLRPHGTILRTGDRAEPDPESLTTTAWMAGSPLSYLTRGHATTGRVLTTVRGYLGLHRAYGLRLFVEDDGGWRLLDVPSAFSMTLDGARWVYAPARPGGAEEAGGADDLEVTTHVPADQHCVQVRLRAGRPRRVLVALHLAGVDDPLPAPAPP
ncbi:hypothetical protein N867_02745, partial [Actinotalea fermentans ATCC 43279 = JCM 9966 = DSM 3133]